jgi:hypothetical protein
MDRRDIRLFGDGKLAPEQLRWGPFGTDAQGNDYWYFNDQCRVYREGAPLPVRYSKATGSSLLAGWKKRSWEVVAGSIDALDELLAKLNAKKGKGEKPLREELAAILEFWVAARRRQEGARAKQVSAVMASSRPAPLRPTRAN